MSLRPRVRTSAPTSAHGSVEQRLWAPVRVALTIGAPGAHDGRSHAFGPSPSTQLPEALLMLILEQLTKATSTKLMCKGINNVLESLNLHFNEDMWRQVVDMLHLPPNSHMSATRLKTGSAFGFVTQARTWTGRPPLTAKQIFKLWCHHDVSIPTEPTSMELIMYTWVRFIIMYHERRAPELQGARESLLFCMDRYGGWADWKQAVGALADVRDIKLLTWFLEKFFLRDNFAQLKLRRGTDEKRRLARVPLMARAGMRDELLGHALSQVFSSSTAIIPPLTYGIPSFPNPYEVLFASLLEPPFKFTLGHVTYAILRNSVRSDGQYISTENTVGTLPGFVMQNRDMLNYWNDDMSDQERLDAILELMWRFEPLFNGSSQFSPSYYRPSPARRLCITLHLFLSAIRDIHATFKKHYGPPVFGNDVRTTVDGRQSMPAAVAQWRSLLDWSQGFEDPNDVFNDILSLPEWFDDNIYESDEEH